MAKSKEKSYEEKQNSIWNRWLGMFALFMIFGTTSLIAAIFMWWKDMYEVGLSFELQPVARSGGYYYLIAGIFYFLAYSIWRGRKSKKTKH